MAPVDDLEFLLGKLDEMEELGRTLGFEEELQQFRGALHSAGEAWTIGDYESLWKIRPTNERSDELLEKIWCWHERHRSISSSSSSSSSWVVRAAVVVISFFNKCICLREIASELKELTSVYQRLALPKEPPQLAKTNTVVRGADVEKIVARIDQLRQPQVEDDDHKLHIIPIFGSPGIGKTTVARMLCVRLRVQQRFDIHIWLHVSLSCDPKRVLRRMASVLLGTDSFDDGEDDILKEKLKDKRYLLVLDDVRNDDPSKWSALKQQLLDISAAAGAQGIVIVTTSRHSVAVMMMEAANSAPPHELQGLSAGDCLRLFRRLREEKKISFPYLEREDEERVGKIIQEKCDGLPVAVLDMAKYLQTIRPPNLTSSDVFKRRIETYNSVSWRYELLPIYLRNCFQFCSLFRQHHDYDMEELGEIWLALRWHAAAAEAAMLPHPELTCYAELWNACYFRYSTDKATYKMQYPVREFSNNLNLLSDERTRGPSSFKTMRIDGMAQPLDNPHGWLHLSLLVDSQTSALPQVVSSPKNLKTMILLREPRMLLSNRKCKISRIPPKLLASMEYLCVLDLQCTMIKKLPRTMGNLLNLRYLNLSATDIATVPRFIGKLQSLMFLKLVNCKHLTRINDAIARLVKLQKFDIVGCYWLVRVPNRIDNMKQLRCFNIKNCFSLIEMPYGLGQCTNLRTLPRYIVRENDGYTIKELQTLTGLEGELRLENLQNIDIGKDAATAELWNKTMLKSLALQWKLSKHVKDTNVIEAVQEVLERLQPNKNLIKLEIISYLGKQFPSWLSGVRPYLASLEEIKLFNLKWCQALPPLGVLPRLRVAEISGMDAITEVDDAFYGVDGTFPSLQRLTLSQMLNLKKWLDVDRRNMFPRLTNLTFIHCPQMVALEMELPSVTELTLWFDNESLYNSKGGLKGLTTSLKKLSISLCQQLLEFSECLGLQELRALEEMEISGCQELTNLPRGIRNINSITSLKIICCNKMTSSPNWSNGELTSLRSLSINGRSLLRNTPPERIKTTPGTRIHYSF